MENFYHVIAVNHRTGTKTMLTAQAVTQKEGHPIISKYYPRSTPNPEVSIKLELAKN